LKARYEKKDSVWKLGALYYQSVRIGIILTSTAQLFSAGVLRERTGRIPANRWSVAETKGLFVHPNLCTEMSWRLNQPPVSWRAT